MNCNTEYAHLTTPIDAMYLIHKALRAEVERVEKAVEQLEAGGSFKPFQRAFYRWALALQYHIEMEGQYLTPAVSGWAQSAEQESGQQQVLSMLEALQMYLLEDLGGTIVIPRTQRQLRGKVVALRIAQEDLLEEEELTILPVLRQELSAEAQWALMQRLFIDEEAEEQTAILDWVVQDLTVAERQWLSDLTTRFEAATA